MIKALVKVAHRLDSLGLRKEADLLDAIIQKMADRKYDALGPLPVSEEGYEEYNKKFGPIEDEMNEELRAVMADFFNNKPASVEEQVKYYGINIAKIENKAEDDGNVKITDWTNTLITDLQNASFEGAVYESLRKSYPGWTPKNFSDVYKIYNRAKKDNFQL